MLDLGIPRPQTPTELAAWLLNTLGVRIPDKACCAGHQSPWAAFCDAYFVYHPATLWKASRGFGGKTYLMALLALTEALTLRASVSILGGSGEQAIRAHEYIRTFRADPRIDKRAFMSDSTDTRTKLLWGNRIIALMASMRAVSGPHPQRLRIDECDLVDLPLLDQALGQPMSKDGVQAHVLFSSAHYVPDGTLTELFKRAQHNGWGTFEWCFEESAQPHGWLDPAEIKRQRGLVTAAMWAVQYVGQEPSPEGRAIILEKVERMFMGAEIAGEGDEFHYREFEPPVPGASYSTAADWAGGQRRGTSKTPSAGDFVEIATLRDDCVPLRLVAYQRFRRLPSPAIIARFQHQCGRYPGTAAHDATGGGQYMDGFMQEGVAPEIMVGLRRAAMFTDYIVSVENEEIVAPRIQTLYRQHKFLVNNDLYGSGHPPDGVVAMAIARKHSRAGTQELRLAGTTQLTPPPPAFGAAVAMPPDASLDVTRGVVRESAPSVRVPSTGLRAALDLFGRDAADVE